MGMATHAVFVSCIIGLCVTQSSVGIKFFRSARRHRIGKAHALHAMTFAHSIQPVVTSQGEQGIEYYGHDMRGVELHIVAFPEGENLYVIHVQPTSFEHQGD